MKTYFAYRLPNEETTHYLKGDLVARASITDVMGRGILICSFQSDLIVQLENIEPAEKEDWIIHYSKSANENTSYHTYKKSFDQLAEAIDGGRFEKLVLTRVKEVETLKTPLDIFEEVNQAYPATFNYILSAPNIGCWIGATPESLCEINDNIVTATSLAGTKKANEQWTKKEIEEQLYVTHFIENKFRDLHCKKMNVDGPHSLTAGPVQHLHTVITAELLSREAWRKVIEDLHPTPATCGIPAKTSKDYIKDLEAHDRSIYTGFIGVFDEDSKKCFVNLRCMEMLPAAAHLFIGGGITRSSDVDKEWEETERKASTLERFL